MSVRWCLCGYRIDRLWQVPEQVHLLSRHSLSWIDVKLDRTSAPLSERSVVIVISPFVSLSEAIFKVLVCLFDVQCHSLWKEVLL